MQYRVLNAVGERFQRLNLDRRRNGRVFVSMIPGHCALQPLGKYVGRFDQVIRRLAQRPCGVGFFASRNDTAFGAPTLDGGLHSRWHAGLADAMHHRRFGIDKHSQSDLLASLACRDFADTVAKTKRLAKRHAGCERVGRQRHPHAADLEQSRNLAQRVGAADIEDQIAVGLDPQVDADLAVSQGHRARGIDARCPPYDIGGRNVRCQAFGCGAAGRTDRQNGPGQNCGRWEDSHGQSVPSIAGQKGNE